MSNNIDESKKLIERLRRDRAALGDKTNTRFHIRYPRFSRGLYAKFIWHFYIFLCGMLFSAMLLGVRGASFLLILIGTLTFITYLRE